MAIMPMIKMNKIVKDRINHVYHLMVLVLPEGGIILLATTMYDATNPSAGTFG
jgi:hypothetical protein